MSNVLACAGLIPFLGGVCEKSSSSPAGFFISFGGGLGYLPHGSPVMMANSLSENLIGFLTP